MAEHRIVDICMDSVMQSKMMKATDRKEWFMALGYFSTYNMSYPTVKIHAENETDMIAVYYNEQNERCYVIGAVWHGDHYGFHS